MAQAGMTEYRKQGQLDALQGKPMNYGCHMGMRSTYEFAKSEYAIGWYEVYQCITKGDGPWS